MIRKTAEIMLEFDKKINEINTKYKNYSGYYNYIELETRKFFGKIIKLDKLELVTYIRNYNFSNYSESSDINHYIYNYLIALVIEKNKATDILSILIPDAFTLVEPSYSTSKIIRFFQLIFFYFKPTKLQINIDMTDATKFAKTLCSIAEAMKRQKDTFFFLNKNPKFSENLAIVVEKISALMHSAPLLKGSFENSVTVDNEDEEEVKSKQLVADADKILSTIPIVTENATTKKIPSPPPPPIPGPPPPPPPPPSTKELPSPSKHTGIKNDTPVLAIDEIKNTAAIWAKKTKAKGGIQIVNNSVIAPRDQLLDEIRTLKKDNLKNTKEEKNKDIEKIKKYLNEIFKFNKIFSKIIDDFDIKNVDKAIIINDLKLIRSMFELQKKKEARLENIKLFNKNIKIFKDTKLVTSFNDELQNEQHQLNILDNEIKPLNERFKLIEDMNFFMKSIDSLIQRNKTNNDKLNELKKKLEDKVAEPVNREDEAKQIKEIEDKIKGIDVRIAELRVNLEKIVKDKYFNMNSDIAETLIKALEIRRNGVLGSESESETNEDENNFSDEEWDETIVISGIPEVFSTKVEELNTPEAIKRSKSLANIGFYTQEPDKAENHLIRSISLCDVNLYHQSDFSTQSKSLGESKSHSEASLSSINLDNRSDSSGYDSSRRTSVTSNNSMGTPPAQSNFFSVTSNGEESKTRPTIAPKPVTELAAH